MNVTPPPSARALVAWAFRHDPAAPAVLGDLHEDFVERARAAGPGAARRWYWREALGLAAGRLLRRPLETLRSTDTMSDTPSLRPVLQDARYALRSLRRHPTFALFAAAVVALGVGATTAVYSVLEPLLLEPLPFGEPQELVWIGNAPPEASGNASLSAVTSRSSNLADFRREARSFEGITGYNAFAPRVAHTLDEGDRPERVTSVGVAHDFLEVLGVDPVVGRSFTEAEGAWEGPRAMILAHDWWVRRFEADPGVVGRGLVVDGEARTVVGVLPPSFDFSSVFSPTVEVDYLEPFPIAPETDRWGNTLIMVGRLRPGASAEAAQADLDAVIAGLQEAQPDRWGLGAHVVPLQERIAEPLRPALLLLAAASGMVLLIVVVNLSSLLLARGPGRQREVAVRRALGAPRGRIVRQLLLESVFVSLAGAALGALLAVAVTAAVRASAVEVPLLERVAVDGGALGFSALVALLTGLLVGAVPALQVSEGGEAGALRDSSRGSTGGRSARRVREALVVAEVGLACGLLVVGGLLLRSFDAVLSVDLGFEPDGAVAWQVDPSRDFESRQAMADFYATVADRVEALPVVAEAGLVDALPLGRNRSWGFRLPGDVEEPNTRSLYPHMAEPGYFEAMEIALLEGRVFTRDDGPEAPPVAVMNESGARATFPGEDAVGRSIQMNGELFEVVGIVEDVRHLSPETPPGTQIYFSYAQVWDFGSMDLVVRSAAPVEEVRSQVAGVLSELDPGMPVDETYTLRSRVDAAVSSRQFVLGILSAFGVAALLLAGLGIYGVLAQSVAERRQEIGIRMALGASASEVVAGVLRRTLALTLLGVGAGAALALVGSRFVASLLFGVEALDPVAFAGTAALLLAVAAVASAAPAVRAARVRGAGVLRSG